MKPLMNKLQGTINRSKKTRFWGRLLTITISPSRPSSAGKVGRMSYLNENELEVLSNEPTALNSIRAFLFFVSPHTFNAFCSMIANPKMGLSNKRALFRDHCLELFRTIANNGAFVSSDPAGPRLKMGSI